MFLRLLLEALNISDDRHRTRGVTPVDPTKHKRDRIKPDVRNQVWTKYHGGNNTGICYCCNRSIQRYHAGWHCSHVLADSRGGSEKIENLRTCCRHCNLSMGDQNLYTYIREKNLNGPGSKNVNNYLEQHPSQKFDKRTNNWGKHNRNKK